MGVECFVGEVKFISHSLGCRRRRRMLTGLESIRARRAAPANPWSGVDWIPCRDGKFRPVEPGTFRLAHRVLRPCGTTAGLRQCHRLASRGSLHPGQHDLARQSGGTLAAKDSTKKARVPDTWVRAFPLALTLANEAHKLFAHHGAYRRVVVMFRCPSSSCTSARSAPRSRKRVAKGCRRSATGDARPGSRLPSRRPSARSSALTTGRTSPIHPSSRSRMPNAATAAT